MFFLCSFTFFSFLASYPAIRSLAQSLFLEHAGIKNRPWAWILTIISLALVIGAFNYLQKRFYVQTLHWIISILSIFIFFLSDWMMGLGYSIGAYAFFVWKEIYIVMLVGLTITFCNNFFKEGEAKLIYGFYGAIGSVGAMIGGYLTSHFSQLQRLDYVLYMGLICTLSSSLLFSQTGKTHKTATKEKVDIAPLHAIKDVKAYVFFMCLLVASSQFAINAASHFFYVILEADIPDKFERTAYLGRIFTSINGVALGIQLLIMPWLLNVISSRLALYLIPSFFLIAVSLLGGGVPLLFAAGLFVGFKSIDYSIFSVVKELLYFPLSSIQKYGAKYITDVFVYRSSKTVIAALLLIFTSKNSTFMILIASLFLWLISVYFLVRHQKKMRS